MSAEKPMFKIKCGHKDIVIQNKNGIQLVDFSQEEIRDRDSVMLTLQKHNILLTHFFDKYTKLVNTKHLNLITHSKNEKLITIT